MLLCEGRPPVIYGDGEQTRDFTYVANVVDGVLRACLTPAVSGERSTLPRVDESRSTCCSIGSRPCERPRRPRILVGAPGDVRDSQADIEKARRLLGHQPQVAFDEGLNKTVEWYRASHLPVA